MYKILFLLTIGFFLKSPIYAQVEAVKNNKLPYHYLVYYPDGYKDNPTKKYPLLMFLHGRSIQGNNLEMVKSYGVIYEILRGLKIDFVVIAPQCQSGWNNDKLIEVLDHAEKTYRIDKKKVYLTGMSMGGYGAWHLAGAYPDRFAACAPVAGGGNLSDAKNLKNLPLWVFHGVKDVPVPVEESRKMVKAIRAEGNKKVEYTERKDWDHGDAVHTFAMPELYNWFLKYERGGVVTEPEPEPPLVVVDDPKVDEPEEPELPIVVAEEPQTPPQTGELPYLDFEEKPAKPEPTPTPNPKPTKKAKWWQFWKWKLWQQLK